MRALAALFFLSFFFFFFLFLSPSFSLVSLKRFLETKYHISIPDEKATPEAFNTVESIVKLVQEYLN